jgi:hypothetical protein
MTGKEVVLTEERFEILEAVLDQQSNMNTRLREQLRWNALLDGEDMGWTRVYGGDSEGRWGMSISELKEWSFKLRNALGNVHMGRGLKLRTNNIWNGGIHYNDDALPGGSGAKYQTKKYIADPLNQANFFGQQAHNRRESALYTDGIYLVLGDPSDYSLETYSIEDIGAFALHPRRKDTIIAYRLDYTDYTQSINGVRVMEWHYTDLYAPMRDKQGFQWFLKENETAPDDRVFFDQHVNTQTGWALGVPDSLTAFAWAKVYRDFVMNGKVMSDAMAQFAFQIATGTKKETDTAAARIAQPSDAGATLIGANSLVPLPTAGKGYDFESGRSLLAIAASALEVSVISLSSDAGNTKGNAATTLDLPTRLAMEARRQLHIEFDRRVLVWMGANPATLEVTFSSLDDASDIYRELQALILALNSGLFEAEPIMERMADLLEVTGNTVPTGWLQPNNINTIKQQAKVAATSSAGTQGSDQVEQPAAQGGPSSSPEGAASSTAAPDQGKNNPAGKAGGNSNDIRRD